MIVGYQKMRLISYHLGVASLGEDRDPLAKGELD